MEKMTLKQSFIQQKCGTTVAMKRAEPVGFPAACIQSRASFRGPPIPGLTEHSFRKSPYNLDTETISHVQNPRMLLVHPDPNSHLQ